MAAGGETGTREAIEFLASQNLPDSDWEFNFLLGYLHLQIKELESSVLFFENSIKHNPENLDAYLFKGEALAMSSSSLHRGWAIKRDHAKQALELAVRVPGLNAWPNLKTCLEIIAQTCINVGPIRDAEAAYRYLIKIDPQNAGYYEKLSQIIADDDLTESITLLERAHDIDPTLNVKADLEFAREALSKKSAKAGSNSIRAKYPSIDDMCGDLRSVITNHLLGNVRQEKLIDPSTNFFAFGSYFAHEIARKLIGKGYQTDYFEVSEHINSTYANRSMIDWAFERCSGQTQTRLDELFSSRQLTPSRLREIFATTDVLIYTLGVAPVFFDRNNGEFIMPKSSALNTRTLAELYAFRTTSVAENLDNLSYIRDALLTLNPKLRFVVTVSPVPLRMTFEFGSAIYADCISKSTLRVVSHEFTMKHPDVIYWPSFEVVRWIGGHVGPYYGADDGASLHVNDEVVQAITDSFIEYFS